MNAYQKDIVVFVENCVTATYWDINDALVGSDFGRFTEKLLDRYLDWLVAERYLIYEDAAPHGYKIGPRSRLEA